MGGGQVEKTQVDSVDVFILHERLVSRDETDDSLERMNRA